MFAPTAIPAADSLFSPAIWSHPAVTIVSLAIGLIGLATSYYFYRRSLIVKKPKWAAWGKVVLEDDTAQSDDVEILFRGAKVSHVAINRIAFWNSGRGTIETGDIARSDPIRVVTQDEGELLDVRILVANKSANQFQAAISSDRKLALISFDFLDKNNGVVLHFITTTRVPLKLVGTIKGALTLPKVDPTRPGGGGRVGQWARRICPTYRRRVLAVTLIMFLFGVFAAFLTTAFPSSKPFTFVTAGIIGLVAAHLFPVIQHEALPVGLEAYYET